MQRKQNDAYCRRYFVSSKKEKEEEAHLASKEFQRRSISLWIKLLPGKMRITDERTFNLSRRKSLKNFFGKYNFSVEDGKKVVGRRSRRKSEVRK